MCKQPDLKADKELAQYAYACDDDDYEHGPEA